MIKIIVIALVLSLILTPVSQRLMAWLLERNRESMAEYALEPGPVCSNIGLGLGIFVALTLGLALAPTLSALPHPASWSLLVVVSVAFWA